LGGIFFGGWAIRFRQTLSGPLALRPRVAPGLPFSENPLVSNLIELLQYCLMRRKSQYFNKLFLLFLRPI
jgi:hypothetical protein